MATSEEFLNALNEVQLANILDNKDEEEDLDNKDEEEDDVDSSQPSPPKRTHSRTSSSLDPPNKELSLRCQLLQNEDVSSWISDRSYPYKYLENTCCPSEDTLHIHHVVRK